MADLTPQQQNEVEELYARVTSIPPTERAAFLRSCDAESAVREEVLSLLEFAVVAEEQLDVPIVSPGAIVEAVDALTSHSSAEPDGPTAIGPYRIIRKLGEGGMGSVYLAEQQKPLRRQVALKIIKLGMDSRAVIARFEAERQALAMMNHPNIARALDAGTTESGRPYFVMEYVDGVRITEFCDEQRLGISARLELFREVCEAIQHAHQKGVIHRDIKPSNVLVHREADTTAVKVIDFGVARATDQQLTEQTLLTAQGVLIGTPEYMSPEQAGGTAADVDTRSDVYSLGVLLYELLVGALPFDSQTLRRHGLNEMHRVIRDQDPPKPTTRLSGLGSTGLKLAEKRRMDLPRLRRELRGELEWIVMKCLEKDRDRRYATASALIDDLDRYLRSEPIAAGPPSMRYRARKFAKRNRALVSAAAIVFVALVTTTIVTSAMFLTAKAAKERAEREHGVSREISRFVQDMITSIDPAVALGRDVSLMREVLDRAADRVDRELTTKPAIAAALHRTIGSSYNSIGLNQIAEQHLMKSVELRRADRETDPMELARSLSSLGNLLSQMSRFDEAEPLLRESLAIRQSATSAQSPESADALLDLAMLVAQQKARSDSEDAEAFYREAIEIHRQHSSTRASLARGLHGLGGFLRSRNRLDEAEEPYREALAIQRAISGADHPDVIPFEVGMGVWLRAAGQYPLAEEHMLRALRIAQSHLSEDHPQRLELMSILAALYQDMKSYEAAETMYRETLAVERRVHGDRHLNVATTANNLASLLYRNGQLAEAESLFKEAATVYQNVLGSEHYWVSIPLNSVACIREQMGDIEVAGQIAEQCLKIRQQTPGIQPWQLAEIETIIGASLTAQTNYDEAEQILLRCLRVLREHYGDDRRVVIQTRRRLDELYVAWVRAEPGKDIAAKAQSYRAASEDATSDSLDSPQP